MDQDQMYKVHSRVVFISRWAQQEAQHSFSHSSSSSQPNQHSNLSAVLSNHKTYSSEINHKSKIIEIKKKEMMD